MAIFAKCQVSFHALYHSVLKMIPVLIIADSNIFISLTDNLILPQNFVGMHLMFHGLSRVLHVFCNISVFQIFLSCQHIAFEKKGGNEETKIIHSGFWFQFLM